MTVPEQVTHEQARAAAQRLINSHFGNTHEEQGRTRIPAQPDDDDLLITRYIRQQEALPPSNPSVRITPTSDLKLMLTGEALDGMDNLGHLRTVTAEIVALHVKHTGQLVEGLRAAMQEACDLLAEHTYGNPARSPGHNARLCLEGALSAAPAAPASPQPQAEQVHERETPVVKPIGQERS